MTETPAYPLRVFYDGSCSVCAAEMAVYRAKEHGGRLLFVDIGSPEFDPAPYGIPLDDFMYEMHAIDGKGRVYRVVDAFAAIWFAFPDSTPYRLLGALVLFPGINLFSRGGYWCFARLRKYLPKTRDACRDGTCRIGSGRPLP
jgi:predicted DCC family thiol-disulfide oxidoreductase YuxK